MSPSDFCISLFLNMRCRAFVCAHPNSKTKPPITHNYETSNFEDMKTYNMFKVQNYIMYR